MTYDVIITIVIGMAFFVLLILFWDWDVTGGGGGEDANVVVELLGVGGCFVGVCFSFALFGVGGVGGGGNWGDGCVLLFAFVVVFAVFKLSLFAIIKKLFVNSLNNEPSFLHE